jgi:hypothetical protein
MFNITEQPAWLDQLTEDASRRLRRNNEILVKGREDVIISPAMKDVDDNQIEDFVRGTFEQGKYTEYLMDIENSNLSKLGPRSVAKPWSERREDLQAYFTTIPTLSREEFRTKVLGLVQEFNLARRLHPVDMQRAVESLESSTSSGLPFMTKKGIVRKNGEADERYVDVFPTVTFTRTQEGGKTRNVMGYGISDVIREMRYHRSFLPFEQTYSWRSAIVSPTATDTAITHMFLTKTTSEEISCLDFSAYDASITPDLSGEAFAFIAGHFAEKFEDEIFEVYQRFATIPFFTPDGGYSGFHGVPSGSAFTNTVDSIVQYLIVYRVGVLSGSDSAQIQGDDGIFKIRGGENEKLIKACTDSGLRVNADKSDLFSDAEGTYLQRYYHTTYRGQGNGLGGVYSIARALLRLKYLERFIDGLGSEEELTGDDYFALRAIAILENCKHHPHFHELIDFARQHDKFKLSFSRAGLKVYESLPERRSRADVTNQYGDRGGIESFETYRYLMGGG